MSLIDEERVAVIVTTYNAEKFIKKTLESVLSQSYKNLEIIVVDDGSQDGTVEILKKLAVNDSRVKIIVLNKNSNLPAVARNVAIKQNKAKYIAFLDHDDLWEKFKIRRQVKYLKENKSIAMTHCRLQVFSNKKFYINKIWYPIIPNSINSLQLIKENKIKFSSVMVRSEVFNSIGLFDEDQELRAIEDLELWIRIAEKFKIGFQDDLMGHYFVSKTSTSHDEKDRVKMERLYKKINIDEEYGGTEKIKIYHLVSNINRIIKLLSRRIAFRVTNRVG
jgi:glycosyltransferase involved in cell wall biosynthesis